MKRGRTGRAKKIGRREFKKLAKLLGLVPIPGSTILTKRFQKLLKRSPVYIITDCENGRWTWKTPINEKDTVKTDDRDA